MNVNQTFYATGSESTALDRQALQEGLYAALAALGRRRKVLIVPPDITRLHSQAGRLTRMACEHYGPAVTDILPAIGTHTPMTEAEIRRMYGDLDTGLFRVHDWRRGIATLGQVPGAFVAEASGGKVDYPWPAQVDRLLVEGGFDLILSIGQVVPHEVAGMANYNKNIFVGTGGAESINKSHFLGAVCDMEKIMGRADTPVRRVLNYASDHFAGHLPIVYVLTVVQALPSGTATRGLFIGADAACFEHAARLSLRVNFQMLDAPIDKAVVWLDPEEYKSTWLGNKSIYRMRMAMADGGELIVLAPGLRQFGEDAQIDRLIRKYGYCGTPRVLEAVERNADLRDNLSAAAHLIHGSSEDRFSVTYCPGHLDREAIKAVGFQYAPLQEMMQRYDPARLSDGWNEVDGQRVYFVSNPGLGLWSTRERFEKA